MTCSYLEMDQHDALYTVARNYPGGLEQLAHRMGMSVNVLRNKLQPRIKTHYPSFEEASLIVEYCREAGGDSALQPIHAQNWRHGLVTIAVPESDHLSDEQLAMTVCRVMKEAGDIAASLQDALRDGRIDRNEMDKLNREFQEAFSALAQWQARISDRFARDTGAPR